MKNWKESRVLLCKGVRTPRESPNFQQKEEQTAQRELQVLGGGDVTRVTHREGPRRGSRLRRGETRASRRESRILAQEVRDWQDEQAAPVVRLDDWKQQHNASGRSKALTRSGIEDPVPNEVVPPAAAETPAVQHIWTLDDFSEEVLAQDRARWEQNRPTFEEARADRKRMEQQFENARLEKARLLKALLGRGCKSPQPAEESEQVHVHQTADCVHHLNFDDTASEPAPTARPQLQGSHSRPLKRHSRPDRAGSDKE